MKNLLLVILGIVALQFVGLSQSQITYDNIVAREKLKLRNRVITDFPNVYVTGTTPTSANGIHEIDIWVKTGTDSVFIYNGSTWVFLGIRSKTTNLTATPTPTTVVVNSDTGTDATIPLADGTNAGIITPAEKAKIAAAITVEVDGSTTNEIELPTQTGNSGKVLTTNGTSPSWSGVANPTINTVAPTMNLDSLNTKGKESYYGATVGNVVKYNFFGDVTAANGADFTKQVSLADGNLASVAGKVRWDVRQKQVAYYTPTASTYFEQPLYLQTGTNYTLRLTQGATSQTVYFSDAWKLSDTISVVPYSTSTLNCVWDGSVFSCNVNRHNVSLLEAFLYEYKDSLDLAFVPQMLGDSYKEHYSQTPILSPVRAFGDEVGGTLDGSRNAWEMYSIGSSNGTKPLVSFSSGKSCFTFNTSRLGMAFKESKKVTNPVRTGQFTLMGWFKIETQSALQYLFTSTNTATQAGIALNKESASTNKLIFRFSTGTAYEDVTSVDSLNIADGWQFVTVEGTGTQAIITLNGTTATGTITPLSEAIVTTNYAVGSFQNGAEPFKGSCAGVVLANKRLSATAIAKYKEASKQFAERGRLDVKSKVREIPNNDFDLTKVTGLLYWSAEQNVWKNTSKTTAATTDGDTVRIVEPLFGKVANNEWFGSTANASPLYRPNYRNGKPALEFKAGNKYYLRGTQETSIPLTTDAFTIFVAACVTDTLTYSSLISNDVTNEFIVSGTSGGAHYNMKQYYQQFLPFAGGSTYTSFKSEYYKPFITLPAKQSCQIYEMSKADSVMDMALSGDGYVRFSKTNSVNFNPYTIGGNGGLVGYVLGIVLCKGSPDMVLRNKIRAWLGERFAITTIQNLDTEPDNDKELYSKRILYQDQTSRQKYNAFPRGQTVATSTGYEIRADWQSSEFHVGADTSFSNRIIIGRFDLNGVVIDTFAPVRQGTVGDHEPYYGNTTYITQDSALFVWTTRDTWGSVDSTKTYWRWIKPVSKVRYSINEFVAGSSDMPGGWAFNTDRVAFNGLDWYLPKYGKTLAANARYKGWLYKRTNGTGAWSLVLTLDGAAMSPEQDPEELRLIKMPNGVWRLYWRDDLTAKIYYIESPDPSSWASTTPIFVANGVSLPAPAVMDNRRMVLTQRESFVNNTFKTVFYTSSDLGKTWTNGGGYLNDYSQRQLGMKDMYSESFPDPTDPRYFIVIGGADTTAGEISTIYFWRVKFPNPN